jgi:hypothetical protein
VRALNEDEFLATMGATPRAVGVDEAPPFDFWTYFESLPRSEWGMHDFSGERVAAAWLMPGDAWEHVLIASEDKNVLLALVLDLERGAVYGHRVLDLNRLYGVSES